MKTAGSFLRECRTKAGMNQADLAAELQISQSDISKIESDHKVPPIYLFREWTIATQTIDLGIAFLYGTELMMNVPDIITNTIVGFANILGGIL